MTNKLFSLSLYRPIISKRILTQSTYTTVTDVLFDLYLSVESSSELGGKIGIFSGIIGTGASGKTDDSNKTVSRIQFTVPVVFPFKKSIY